MLQKKTLERKTFELLDLMMQDEYISDFSLAGGTALALYLGHRKSIDLDFFSIQDFNVNSLMFHLENKYNFKMNYLEENTIKGGIDNVKVEFLAFKYPLIKDIEIYNNIRLYSKEDIIAMELNAIIQNGSRLKDFVDIAFLSKEYSLNDMAEFYNQKFNRDSYTLILKAIGYFDDINHNDKVELIDTKYQFKLIEKRINDMIKYPDKKI